MNRQQVQTKIDAAFDAHVEKLVDVLCANLEFDPDKAPEYVGNFHRGLAHGLKARDLVMAELGTMFPE